MLAARAAHDCLSWPCAAPCTLPAPLLEAWQPTGHLHCCNQLQSQSLALPAHLRAHHPHTLPALCPNLVAASCQTCDLMSFVPTPQQLPQSVVTVPCNQGVHYWHAEGVRQLVHILASCLLPQILTWPACHSEFLPLKAAQVLLLLPSSCLPLQVSMRQPAWLYGPPAQLLWSEREQQQQWPGERRRGGCSWGQMQGGLKMRPPQRSS